MVDARLWVNKKLRYIRRRIPELIGDLISYSQFNSKVNEKFPRGQPIFTLKGRKQMTFFDKCWDLKPSDLLPA
jgi:hypothetical protein